MVTTEKFEKAMYSLSLKDIMRAINRANNNYDRELWQAIYQHVTEYDSIKKCVRIPL